ncbi:hypothetical protein LOZ80_19435 [Paenibacillus sp. HWE-109]|uniref:hypothetical protein n=1 Tax=Paenibacillus sp. HWE-109 TaxID=1306526 RepID=UPI001EDFDA79|nr:hypothetical protein [Paenibacillus sp. HWE-109]UKS30990.1 hypothetical protein LOZ80_19435 [Paenibacillus sp. HWE-109]
MGTTVGALALSPGFGCFKVLFHPYGVANERFELVNAEFQRYGGGDFGGATVGVGAFPQDSAALRLFFILKE